jgi:hypothetical protein
MPKEDPFKKDLNVCKKYGFMHTNIINKHFSKSDKIQDFHMIVDDDSVVVDESIKSSFIIKIINDIKISIFYFNYIKII